ncbi:hypothetical protein niasHT_000312 [Heterodera trifolii]|uniref:Uncharacterized protein n=1 Tax=Heterodera trifolii TaxID=157864 RepID=A0ABD2LTH3_9BILA
MQLHLFRPICWWLQRVERLGDETKTSQRLTERMKPPSNESPCHFHSVMIVPLICSKCRPMNAIIDQRMTRPFTEQREKVKRKSQKEEE